MAIFVAILSEKQRETLSDDLLRRHIDHLRQLSRDGQLVLCGPFEDNEGAMQVLATSSRKEADDLLRADPFVAERYYLSYVLRELIAANEHNDWLRRDAQTAGNLTD